MKNLFLNSVFLLLSMSAIAQVPQAFNYQGIARDGSGAPLITANISLRISILKGNLPGTLTYKENHLVQTNKLGLFAIEVGHGSSRIGSFEAIDWGAGDHYIQIEMDPDGGTNFTLLGESQLLSVPYALYAGNSTAGESLWQKNASGIHYNDGNVGIGTENPQNQLSILGNDSDGEGRILVTLDNESTSNRSWAAMRLSAGDGGSYTYLNHHALSYDYDGDKYTDFGQLSSNGRGLILRADAQYGVIKFLAGGDPLSPEERMRITGTGNVGIGTENPLQKLTIEGSDPILEARNYLSLNNKSRSNRSDVYMSLSAGDEQNMTYLTHHSETYDLDNNSYADFGQLESRGGGLNLAAPNTKGVLRFYTSHDLSNNLPLERMRIAANGYIGIGTKNPTNVLTIDGDVGTGDQRFFISVNNNSLSNRSFSAMKFTAGAGTSMTTFGHNSETYDVDDNVTADFGGIFSSGAGIHLTAGGEDGIIKFLTGRNDIGWSYERMRLSSIGNLGIGTEDPVTRLQVAGGDVYIEDINNGVIMKSPNGNCWRMTINNDGSVKTTAISCP